MFGVNRTIDTRCWKITICKNFEFGISWHWSWFILRHNPFNIRVYVGQSWCPIIWAIALSSRQSYLLDAYLIHSWNIFPLVLNFNHTFSWVFGITTNYGNAADAYRILKSWIDVMIPLINFYDFRFFIVVFLGLVFYNRALSTHVWCLVLSFQSFKLFVFLHFLKCIPRIFG